MGRGGGRPVRGRHPDQWAPVFDDATYQGYQFCNRRANTRIPEEGPFRVRHQSFRKVPSTFQGRAVDFSGGTTDLSGVPTVDGCGGEQVHPLHLDLPMSPRVQKPGTCDHIPNIINIPKMPSESDVCPYFEFVFLTLRKLAYMYSPNAAFRSPWCTKLTSIWLQYLALAPVGSGEEGGVVQPPLKGGGCHRTWHTHP